MGLKRMNKNRISYHVMCLLLAVFIMFCALVPRLSVSAADTGSSALGEDYQNYVAFKDSLAKTWLYVILCARSWSGGMAFSDI